MNNGSLGQDMLSAMMEQMQPKKQGMDLQQANNTWMMMMMEASEPDCGPYGCVPDCYCEDFIYPTRFTNRICIQPANSETICIGCNDRRCCNDIYTGCYKYGLFPWVEDYY